jgi:hypothetical protein
MTPSPINEELNVQQPAIDWLKKHWGYEEIKSAEEDDAWGAPIDSVGLMDGRVLLIEVKVTVSGGQVRHNPTRPGSIEGKIARTLVGLYEGRTDYNLPAIRRIWDRTHPLVFAILAKNYTERGLEEVRDVFKRRSSEWLFDYRIWQWTGHEMQQMDIRHLNPPPRFEQYNAIRIPLLVERASRNRPPSLDEHREAARCRNLLHIFDYIIKRAGELGYKINRTGSGITLLAAGRSRKRDSSIGVFVTRSSQQRGMVFGFTPDRSEIPGCPAPKVGVYSGPYRYLRTIDEVEIALRMFAPSF